MSTIHVATAPVGQDKAHHPARLAGLLFLASAATSVVIWCAHRPWAFPLRWPAVADVVIQAALGMCLLRMRRSVVAVALSFILIASAYPLSRALFSLHRSHPAVQTGPVAIVAILAGPLSFGIIRALPFVVLLVGTRTRRRRVLGIIAFVLWEFTLIALGVMAAYAPRYSGRRSSRWADCAIGRST